MSDEQIKYSRLVLHLRYCIVIFLLISSVVGGLALLNQNVAINGLSNAGLLLSIVLAIIAILITLWDVAGQKDNIASLKKTAENLKAIMGNFENISVENESSMKELKDIIFELNERVILYESKIAKIESYIKNSDDNVGVEQLQKILEENNFSNKNNFTLEKPTSILVDDVVEILNMEFKNGDSFSFKVFYNILSKHYNVSVSRARSVLNGLIHNGDIEEYEHSSNNTLFYRLR